MTALENQRAALQNRVRKLTKEKDALSAKHLELIEKLNESRTKRQAIERSLKKAEEMDINENDRHLSSYYPFTVLYLYNSCVTFE